ncbi:MAG: PTS sugar transporter subunit IIA [Verrucomicrobia bacterium]|jgi:mannitol/fructose-specific phosphotransferase system IIA component (Ntr-type)|nr:PTS sugar transporter subunit IIA [Verrucomicrobiota bacterium]
MDFQQALRECCLSAHLKGETKDAIIEEMIDILDRAGRLPDRALALAAVQERESKMSTGMQFGVAIPHGKTDSIETLVTAVALKPEGIDFAALDGAPSTIFVMTLSPVSDTGPHIQYLSEISKLLNHQSLRDALLASKSEEDMMAVLMGT